MTDILERATKDFYWGILPREEMQRFVEAARSEGFDKARTTFKFTGRFDYADDFSRADFHFFLTTPKNAEILDLGSGYGNVTIPLSYHYEQVTAVDASRELLELSRIRAIEKGRDNISFVHVDPLGSGALPFADASYDLVILNGVLEWVGLSGDKEDPREIQAFLLREIKRVLKPGGKIYIGIENRLFPGWWARDPHSKLPYTVFLPRPLARWYAKRRGHEDYRTYIYSFFGFKKLFAQQGLAIQKLFIPYTTYRDPVALYPRCKEAAAYLFGPQKGGAFYTKKWQTFLGVLRHFGLEHLFIASFMFVLSATGSSAKTSSLLSRTLSEKYPEQYKDSDILIKLPSPGASTLTVAALHQGSSKPYGNFTVARFPDTHGKLEVAYKDAESH